MAFISLDANDLAQDKPFSTDLALQMKDNFDALNGALTSLSYADIPNGSFEVDSDANDEPDNWVLTEYPGGTVARDTTTVAHGSASLKMVHPGGGGNGGGYAVSDYVACNELEYIALRFVHWATAAGMKNQVILYWYTAAKVACATPTTTIYDSTSNPTSATVFVKEALPPSTARFFKVRVVGGESSVDVAGSAYFDGLTLTMTTNEVLYATSLSSLGAVGTYAFLVSIVDEAVITAGSTYSGSNLRYGSIVTGGILYPGGTPSGTWMAVGTGNPGSGAGDQFVATSFLRIA